MVFGIKRELCHWIRAAKLGIFEALEGLPRFVAHKAEPYLSLLLTT